MSAACLSCGADTLADVLSLGLLPLANALVDPDLAETDAPDRQRVPLTLAFCCACALVQLTERVAPERLFREYPYFSSYSDSFVNHARVLAERLCDERHLGADSLVIEAASNDGYLLQHYRARGVGVLGIEPARNVAAVARARGIPTLGDFFGRDLATRLRAEGRQAQVFHAHNVLAHVPDPNGFLAGVRTLLADDGLLIIEVPYVRALVEHNQFDTIYHEHLAYFSLLALSRLCARHDLRITHVERLPVHGGSLRVWAQPGTGAQVQPSVAELLAEEQASGLDALGFYAQFGARVGALVAELRARLVALHAAGRRLAAYGASAKGAVLLNVLDLPAGTLTFVVDRSPHKQGRLMPGVRLPIRSPEALLEQRPDLVLLLVWNLLDEVLEQQATYRRLGGRFLVPIPAPREL